MALNSQDISINVFQEENEIKLRAIQDKLETISSNRMKNVIKRDMKV